MCHSIVTGPTSRSVASVDEGINLNDSSKEALAAATLALGLAFVASMTSRRTRVARPERLGKVE